MPIGIYIRTKEAKEAMRLGQKKRVHKQDCSCCICKSKRREYIGINHPCFGKKHSLKSRMKSGSANRNKTKENCEHIRRAMKNRKKRYDSGELIYYFLGRHHSKKSKNKMSINHAGGVKHHTQKTKIKIGNSQRGKYISEEQLKKVLKIVCKHPNNFEKNVMNYLNIIYPKKFKYTGDGSFIKYNRSIDFYSKSLNTVVLANGNYFHCNPRKYSQNYYNTCLKKTAKEIWAYDKETVRRYELLGFKVIIIWEDELDSLIENIKCKKK